MRHPKLLVGTLNHPHSELVNLKAECSNGQNMQDMLASWSDPFKAAFGHNSTAQYYELSFVESAVCTLSRIAVFAYIRSTSDRLFHPQPSHFQMHHLCHQAPSLSLTHTHTAGHTRTNFCCEVI